MQCKPGRWAVCVEYDGSDYCGWQTQPHAPNIQDLVEASLSQVADHAIRVTCCGRTDAGVHALGQVVHFDTTVRRCDKAWVFGANSNLPASISLRWAQPVSADFHARYCARARHYRYVFFNHRARSALFAGRAAHCSYALDVEAMHGAGQALLGEHDFSAFRAAGCQSRTPMRNVHSVTVAKYGNFVTIDVCANAFLHHMVRNIVGSLLDVGRGRQSAAWMAQLLYGRDRRAAGATAPAGGLYLVKADYPERFGILRDENGSLFAPIASAFE